MLTHYQGFGQQAAIRTLLTSEITVHCWLICPPVAVKVCSPTPGAQRTDKHPHAGDRPHCRLAIEQADDMQKLLRGADQDQVEVMFGSEAKISPRVRQLRKNQSGNTACSLLFPRIRSLFLVPVLFELSRLNMIGAIVIEKRI